MTKSEFLMGLSEALSELPEEIRRDNISYYASYIEEQIRSGRTEENVMEELGEPVWIANSILEAAAGDKSADETTYDYETDRNGKNTYSGYDSYDTVYSEEQEKKKDFFKSFELKPWMITAIVAGVAVLILVILGALFGAVFRFLFWILSKPLFWIVLAVLLGYGYFKNRSYRS